MTSGSAAIGETPLLERERELAVFDELLSAVESGPGLVLIEGPAGIGKSRLLDELIGRAAQTGMRVLTGRGAHLEGCHIDAYEQAKWFEAQCGRLARPIPRSVPSEIIAINSASRTRVSVGRADMKGV
jgi:hypothetical protein